MRCTDPRWDLAGVLVAVKGTLAYASRFARLTAPARSLRGHRSIVLQDIEVVQAAYDLPVLELAS